MDTCGFDPRQPLSKYPALGERGVSIERNAMLEIGDFVLLRSKPNVYTVTDYNEQDGILIGYAVHPELFSDPNLGEPGYEPKLLVTNIEDVKHIMDYLGNEKEDVL